MRIGHGDATLSYGHTFAGVSLSDHRKILDALRGYFLLPGEPDARLNPRWLARRLALRLNGRPDFFGVVVNMAARGQGLSRGHDVLVTDAVLADIEAEALTGAPRPQVAESFDAESRGIPAPVGVHRLVLNAQEG